jgi:TolA-binding protein
MATGVPVLRTKRIWYFMIPQILVIASLFYLFSTEDEYTGMFGAILVYYFIIYCLRTLVASDHRKAINTLKKGDYEKAMEGFKKSARFFTENAWVDKYRCITLLSASKKTYREMALCNVGFCLTQTKRGAEAIEVYKDVLQKYPENDIAIAALRTLESV